MRNLILSALLLASAFQTAMGEQDGDWTYIVENGGATITASTATGAVTIPSVLGGYAVKKVGNYYPSIFGESWTPRPTQVTSLVIPNSVTSIGEYALAYCPGLTTLTIGSGVTSIGGYAFSYCTGLTGTLTIPNSVTSIGDNAFQGCTSLTGTLTIPNSVTSIGRSAFNACTGLTGTLTIPNSVTSIGGYAFYYCTSLTGTLTIPNSVTSIGDDAFAGCSLTSITMPDRFIGQVAQIGIRGQAATDYLVNALANNDAFVTAVANKILAKNGNYGLSVKSELETLATYSELTSAIGPLATKTQITTAINEGKASGIASVTASPNTWSLFTTSQIQNMAVGDLVLTKNVGGTFTLNYDIEQSTDLQTWTPYQALSLPLNGLPTDKAFVRIKAK